MSSTITIESMLERVQAIRENRDATIRPGAPFRMTRALSLGDCLPQGDVYLHVADDSIPKGFYEATGDDFSLQMAPGTTRGSRHILDSRDGVRQFLPKGWGPDYTGLIGPKLFMTKERVLNHPKHGPVTFEAGMVIQSTYQRDLDKENAQKRVRD